MRARVRSVLLVFTGILAKEAKLLTRYVGSLFTILALPFMLSGLFVGIGYAIAGPSYTANFASNTGVQSPVLYLTLGGVLMIASMVMVENTSSVIREEQLIGTFELHYLTPNSTVAIWLLHALAQSILLILVFTLDLTLAVALGGSLLTPYECAEASLVILLGLLPLAGLGMVVAALTMRFKEVWAVTNTVNAFVAMLSGFYYPLEVFPTVVQAVSNLLPTSHAAQILRALVTGTASGLDFTQKILVLAALGSVYLLLGKTVYEGWEDEAKRRGELSKY
ncbi:ABC transporter permease [Infirmifilum lucidum]|uniref:ABC transporter permease n=1 Tax=Infirmifilum lucidum TaxID=2776706 RepID=A0A7L9FIY0_9CREN|nr:ABC transporter permease [Infirmifilum lucidum]QOJ78745.1 ABC transporter permease [Infirmifilum lucidum]